MAAVLQRTGQAVTFPDAVFTAATSVCVTGLSTVVMAVQWSPIGKAVILCLIQIGGIGLIALANMIFISLRRKISLKNRRIIKESYNLDEMGGVVSVVRSVVKCVFLAEGIGALLYAFCFVPEFGIKKVWCMPYFWRYLHSATQGSIFSGKQAFRYM